MFPVENAAMRLSRYRRQTSAGRCVFIAHVNDSSPVEPNFRPAMKITFAASGSARERVFVQQVAADRLDAMLFERPLRCRRGEARHANHLARQASRVERAARHPRQGRTHLAGDSEDEDVPFHTSHGVDRCGRGLAQQLLEVIDVANRSRDLHLRPIMSRD